MRHRPLPVILGLLLAVTLGLATSEAWAVATVEGTVTDAQGAAVANTTITLEQADGTGRATARTDDSGRYRVTVPPGTYTITTAAQGFRSARMTGVRVTDNTTTRQDLTLTAAFAGPPPGFFLPGPLGRFGVNVKGQVSRYRLEATSDETTITDRQNGSVVGTDVVRGDPGQVNQHFETTVEMNAVRLMVPISLGQYDLGAMNIAPGVAPRVRWFDGDLKVRDRMTRMTDRFSFDGWDAGFDAEVLVTYDRSRVFWAVGGGLYQTFATDVSGERLDVPGVQVATDTIDIDLGSAWVGVRAGYRFEPGYPFLQQVAPSAGVRYEAFWLDFGRETTAAFANQPGASRTVSSKTDLDSDGIRGFVGVDLLFCEWLLGGVGAVFDDKNYDVQVTLGARLPF